MILWAGARLGGSQHAKASDCMTYKICGGELMSNMTRVTLKKGHETEDFLHYFDNRLVLCDDKYVPQAEWFEKVKTNGAMFRI